MQSKIRITVPLTLHEWNALQRSAELEKREPRMQASHLINHALFGGKKSADAEQKNPVVATLPEHATTGFEKTTTT